MNFLKTTFLLSAMTALFGSLGYMMGGASGAMIALGIALVLNGLAWWNSDKMVLRMHGAREVSRHDAPGVYEMVERLARNAGLPMPKVYIINSPQPNAFATGRSPDHAAVAATTGIMELLEPHEFEGVMAHELAHIQHRDTLIMTVAAAISGAIGFLSNMMMFTGRGREGGAGGAIIGLLAMILAPMIAMLVQMAISRTREYSADRRGAEICGDPEALASALVKISNGIAHMPPLDSAERNPATAHMFILNPLSGGGFTKLFSTHPDTQERINLLVAMARNGWTDPNDGRGGGGPSVGGSRQSGFADFDSPGSQPNWGAGKPDLKPKRRRGGSVPSGRG
ncbi:MAG: zinc metalloprotease HtpX [Alphaproteobacteria bacterium]